ncbi:MAG: EF-P lysine aminoacylase EpmA [Alphaproteobacteria bacterium]
MAWWHPDHFMRKVPYLQERARIFGEIRAFFDARGYLEVDTPALQTAPCMEAHIQAFKTELLSADRQSKRAMYLHTSPEFAMKKLLVAGLPKIYQLAKVFRNAEGSSWHSPEFTMLEWYQRGMDYKDMMEETADLVRHVLKKPVVAEGRSCDPRQPWEKITVVEALRKYADIDIIDHLPRHPEQSEGSSPGKIPRSARNDKLEAPLEYLRAEAKRIGVYVSPHDDWENALLKILMEKVETRLGSPAPAIIYDYPVSMAALSRPKPEDPRFAERFEVYVCGIELANAFGELTDAKVQRERFLADVALRKKVYGDDYPVDEDFLRALEFGLPACSGNALGVDRLVMLATGADNIALVQAAPV